ncbi:hypothetical protein OKW45_002681 [Paraburkholderia sp. WSM4175]|uniref:hypothetical protein n=1 Tax=Paraburkholderia sp. WSM4175 TaxID=2991072 RepID=UPI003D1EA338
MLLADAQSGSIDGMPARYWTRYAAWASDRRPVSPVVGASSFLSSGAPFELLGASADDSALTAENLPALTTSFDFELRPKLPKKGRSNHRQILTAPMLPKNLTVAPRNGTTRHALMPRQYRISPMQSPEKPHF